MQGPAMPAAVMNSAVSTTQGPGVPAAAAVPGCIPVDLEESEDEDREPEWCVVKDRDLQQRMVDKGSGFANPEKQGGQPLNPWAPVLPPRSTMMPQQQTKMPEVSQQTEQLPQRVDVDKQWSEQAADSTASTSSGSASLKPAEIWYKLEQCIQQERARQALQQKANATAADDAAEAGNAPMATATAPAAAEQPIKSMWQAASAAQWPSATRGSMDATLTEQLPQRVDVPVAKAAAEQPSATRGSMDASLTEGGGRPADVLGAHGEVNLEDSGDEMDISGVDKDLEKAVLLGEPAESSALEWGTDVADASDFVVAKGVDPEQFLNIGPVSDSLIERLGLDVEDAKKEMFPEYLQPRVWQKLGVSKALAKMQAMKGREIEKIRWRSSSAQVPDPQFQCLMHSMKSALWLWCRTKPAGEEMGHLESVLCQGGVKAEDFLVTMNRKSLSVSDLRKKDQQSRRKEYRALLEKLPTIAIKKVEHEQLQTIVGHAQALQQLVNKHTGELVELEESRVAACPWWLVRGTHDQFQLSEQWFCTSSGQAVGPGEIQKEWTPFNSRDPKATQQVELEMDNEITRVLSQEPSLASSKKLVPPLMQPDWDKQQYRVTVPCVGTDRYCWVRTGAVITLGQLFLILGRSHEAKLIL